MASWLRPGRPSALGLLSVLTLKVAVAADLSPVEIPPPFQAYPVNSTACGRPGFGPPTGPSPCPVDVCSQKRQACAAAAAARIKCYENSWCRFSTELQTLADVARPICDEAKLCVESACYSATPTNGKGEGCAVRSYFTGQCCCVNCGAPCVEAAFTSSAGADSAAQATGQGLGFNQCLTINGLVDLATVVYGSWGAKVHGIRMKQGSDPLLPYVIEVDATGPKEVEHVPLGYFTLNFAFTDRSGQKHGGEIQVVNPGRRVFSFAYDSDDGAIVNFEWSRARLLPEVNYGFFGLPWAASNSFAQSARGLPPGGRYPYNDPSVVINGGTNYSTSIRSGWNVVLYSMQVLPDGPSPNNAKIVVDAKGRGNIDGGFGGLFLYFCDMARTTYYHIRVRDDTRQVYTFKYSSADPTIRMIFWSDFAMAASELKRQGCFL